MFSIVLILYFSGRLFGSSRSYIYHFLCRDSTTMHGSLIVGMEQRLDQIKAKLSDVDARASEEADCATNERDLDRFIYSGT